MAKKLSRSISTGSMATGVVKAVGVWFLSRATGRYLYLLRDDPKHPDTWGLPGGKIEANETLLGGMERECTEELGQFPAYQQMLPLEKFTSADGVFEYYTWVCVIAEEFTPVLNNEHTGYAWIDRGIRPKPMHPGLWNTTNLAEIRDKISRIENSLFDH